MTQFDEHRVSEEELRARAFVVTTALILVSMAIAIHNLSVPGMFACCLVGVITIVATRGWF